MKNKIYSVFYLIIILFYLLRPVIPYIDYSLNKDYISKYLCEKKAIPGNCCQGKCYLDKQLQKNSIPDDSDRDSGNKNFQDKRLEDHFKTDGILISSCEFYFLLESYYKSYSSDPFLVPAFVPPKG